MIASALSRIDVKPGWRLLSKWFTVKRFASVSEPPNTLCLTWGAIQISFKSRLPNSLRARLLWLHATGAFLALFRNNLRWRQGGSGFSVSWPCRLGCERNHEVPLGNAEFRLRNLGFSPFTGVLI